MRWRPLIDPVLRSAHDRHGVRQDVHEDRLLRCRPAGLSPVGALRLLVFGAAVTEMDVPLPRRGRGTVSHG